MTKQGSITWNVWTLIGEKTLIIHYSIKSEGNSGIGDLRIESQDGSKPPELSEDALNEIILECMKDAGTKEPDKNKLINKFDFSKN